jgi:hypothetical protein
LNREELEPRWGAWKPAILAIAGGSVMIGLMISWIFLETIYGFIAWLFGFFSNRHLSLAGSWRLAGASLLPGALFLLGAIVLYGTGALDLVRLAVAAGVHFSYWMAVLICRCVAPAEASAGPSDKRKSVC